jgi:hypothetical protein
VIFLKKIQANKNRPRQHCRGLSKKEDMREKEYLIKKTVLFHALLITVLDIFLCHYRLTVGEVFVLVTVTVVDLYVFKDVIEILF